MPAWRGAGEEAEHMRVPLPGGRLIHNFAFALFHRINPAVMFRITRFEQTASHFSPRWDTHYRDRLFLSHSAALSPRNAVTESVRLNGKRSSQRWSTRNGVHPRLMSQSKSKPCLYQGLFEGNQKESRCEVTHKIWAGLRRNKSTFPPRFPKKADNAEDQKYQSSHFIAQARIPHGSLR